MSALLLNGAKKKKRCDTRARHRATSEPLTEAPYRRERRVAKAANGMHAWGLHMHDGTRLQPLWTWSCLHYTLTDLSAEQNVELLGQVHKVSELECTGSEIPRWPMPTEGGFFSPRILPRQPTSECRDGCVSNISSLQAKGTVVRLNQAPANLFVLLS